MALCLAIADRMGEIGRQHLLAALQLWSYSSNSIRYLFGNSFGNAKADRIYSALQDRHPEPLSRSEIQLLFGRNAPKADIDLALTVLFESNLATKEKRQTGGRSAEVWSICTKKTT
jgi:hypothetical protein